MNKEKIPPQEEVWDEIAESWNERRKESGPRIIRFVQESKGNFLDLGCGSGRNILKNDNLTFYLVDFSQIMLNFAEKKTKKLKIKFKLIKTDVSNLSCFEDDFFDNALFIATLHCLDRNKRIKSLKELHRVLKHKGKALISVWSTNHPAFKRFKNKKEIFLAWRTNLGEQNEKRNLRYYYFYTEDELLKDLKKTGFKVLDIRDMKENTGFIVLVEKG